MKLNECIKPIMNLLTKVDEETLYFIFNRGGLYCRMDYLTVMVYLQENEDDLNLPLLLDDIESNYIEGCKSNGVIVTPKDLPEELPKLIKGYVAAPLNMELKNPYRVLELPESEPVGETLEELKDKVLGLLSGAKGFSCIYMTHVLETDQPTNVKCMYSLVGKMDFEDEVTFTPRFRTNDKQVIK